MCEHRADGIYISVVQKSQSSRHYAALINKKKYVEALLYAKTNNLELVRVVVVVMP